LTHSSDFHEPGVLPVDLAAILRVFALLGLSEQGFS
jgi:hypothetical protein